MNKSVRVFAITASLGGFLFGFDTAVISGVEETIQRLWVLDDLMHGLAIAIALYGTVLGAMFGGIPSDRIGRRKTLILIGALYSLSALGSALAPEVYSFMFFRFIGGIGVGASSVAAPLYISEISPPAYRGRLVALFQFSIVLGIFLAYVSNYLLEGLALSWRWMIGVETIPALAFMLLAMAIPESPRWLIVVRKDLAGGRAVLEKIFPTVDIDHLIGEIKATISDSTVRVWLFSKAYKVPLMLAFFFAFFNQASGINAIIYYAPRIFKLTGLEASASLLSTAGIGLVNLIFTILGMMLIDKMGRKKLMYIGSLGLILALSLISFSFYSENFGLTPIYFFMFIGFFAMSQGAVIWVFISEIFPNRIRASGQAFGSLTHWIFAAIIANIFPMMVSEFHPGLVFSIFAIMMVAQLLFVWKVMPETKGLTLEEMERGMLR